MDFTDVRILAPPLVNGIGIVRAKSTQLHPRILIVTKRLDRGGTEQHISLIAPMLKTKGIEIELFLLERGGVLEDVVARKNIHIAGLRRTTGKLIHLIRTFFALCGHLRRRKPNAVHFFLPEPYLLGSLAAIMTGQNIRLMSRRSLDHYQRNHPVLARVERWLHRSTSGFLGNSRDVIDQLSHEVGSKAKVGLIYNGVALQRLPLDAITRLAARAALGLTESMFVLVIVANLIAYKGYKDLLEALALIAQSLPGPWKLIAVGRDEGIGTELRQNVIAHGLEEHVVWLGERDDVPSILAAADVFVLPSHQEGFSNALIEAMACGLPVIATAVGGNVDAVVNGVTGNLVSTHSPEQLAEAILQLALDSSRRESYGAAARQRVEQLYSLEACVQLYENLYRGLPRIGSDSVQAIIGSPIYQLPELFIHPEMIN